MIAFAKKFTDQELMRQGSAQDAREYIWATLRWGCYVYGIALNETTQFMVTPNMPGTSLLSMVVWAAAKGHEVPPTPGYDSEGRECWDYPVTPVVG